jgi:type VI secretion system ImpJ/VasE family protein
MSIKIHWQEGLFLQPHHLQRMQKGIEDGLSTERRLGWPYPYGLIEARLSPDALANKRVQFDKLRAIMPSGLEVNYPASAELPSFDIAQAFSKGTGSFTILLGVPLWQGNRANTVPLGPDSDTRVKLLYRVSETECYDENTGENPKPVQIRKINSRLMFEQEDTSDMEVLPLLRIVRAVGVDLGMPKEDPEYVPPCLLLTGSPALRQMVRDLVNQIEATRKELVDRVRKSGFTFETMRGPEFERVLFLRTVNRYSARLPALIEAPAVAPFDVYLELRELLGELAALQIGRDPFESAPYRHDNQFLCFSELCERIRDLLKIGGPRAYMELPFKNVSGVFTANFSDEHFTKPNAYYLAINTKLDLAVLARHVQDGDKFKLMAYSLKDKAIRGVELKEERVAPLGLPSRVGLHYFRLERAGRGSALMWQQINTEKTAALQLGREIDLSDAAFTIYMTEPTGASV